MDVDSTTSIIVSSLVVLLYTTLGGLYSVTYTDAYQMVVCAFGLVSAMLIIYNFALFVAVVPCRINWLLL